MKKALSLLLCLIMVFGLSASAFAADESSLPTIYLSGKANTPIYMGDGTLASNPDFLDRAGYIKEAAGPVLEELAIALLTDDYSVYVDSLVNATAPIYEDLILDSDGNAQFGTHINWDYRTAGIDKNAKTIHFYYDWRLSSMEVADQLDIFIERVLKATGKDGVNIHCRCIGSNFAMTYIAKSYNNYYDHPFRVRNVMLNTSGLVGYLIFEALVSDSVEISPDKTVDASTGLFRDTTWFIKNIKHDNFPANFNVIFEKFCASDGLMTVWSDPEYPQYFDLVDGKVVIDDGSDAEDTSWTKNPFALLIKLLTAFFNKLRSVFVK